MEQHPLGKTSFTNLKEPSRKSHFIEKIKIPVNRNLRIPSLENWIDKIINNPTCLECYKDYSTKPYWFECEKFANERKKLREYSLTKGTLLATKECLQVDIDEQPKKISLKIHKLNKNL